VFAGCVNCQYYWRQGFSHTGCIGDFTYAEVYPTSCVKDPDSGLYQRADCSSSMLTIWQCEDSNCTECPNNDTHAFATCSDYPDNLNFKSESYKCSGTVPDFENAYVQTGYPPVNGACDGNMAFQIYRSLDNFCAAIDMDTGFTYSCNSSNNTVTRMICDTSCSQCKAVDNVDSCIQYVQGFYISTLCSNTTTHAN